MLQVVLEQPSNPKWEHDSSRHEDRSSINCLHDHCSDKVECFQQSNSRCMLQGLQMISDFERKPTIMYFRDKSLARELNCFYVCFKKYTLFNSVLVRDGRLITVSEDQVLRALKSWATCWRPLVYSISEQTLLNGITSHYHFPWSLTILQISDCREHVNRYLLFWVVGTV